MTFAYVAAGALAGLLLGMLSPGGAWMGIALGACAGWLLARLRIVEARLRALEARQAEPMPSLLLRPPGTAASGTATPQAATAEKAAFDSGGASIGGAVPGSHAGAPPLPSENLAASQAMGDAERPAPRIAAPGASAPAAGAAPSHAFPAAGGAAGGGDGGPPETFAFDPFAWLRRWLTEGNAPAKVGVIVLFAGVAALLKYASDEGWLSVPIALRLAGVALAAIVALAFGFRERNDRPTFAVTLQGGAIGILVLTIFAALRLYHLLPATLAFALLVAIVAASCLLAVLQDARALAVLGSLAGFLAPILVSTGSGNHVALFSWYALLDLSIFAIAWFKAWRMLNLLGFVSTFAIATAWGVLRYEPEQFWTTEPFLALFFALYCTIPVLYGKGRITRGQAIVDGALVFGAPIAALGLQALLLRGELLPLALSALAIAAVELCVAHGIWRRPEMRVLAESYAALAIAFATLGVPLALSARTAASVFAVEGAALIWLGLRQDRPLARRAGVGLQAIAALILLANEPPVGALPILNGGFASAFLLALGAGAGALAFWRIRRAAPAASALFLLGAFFWILAGVNEIDDHVPHRLQGDFSVGFAALCAGLFAAIHRRVQGALPAWASAAALALGARMLLAQIAHRPQPLSGWGAAAWLAWAVFGLQALRDLREHRRALAVAHIGWLLTWTAVFGVALRDLAVRAGLGDGWREALLVLPLLAALALALRRPAWIAAPIGDRFQAHRPAAIGVLAAATAIAFGIGLFLRGDFAPLPFLPLANPIDLASVGALLLLACAGKVLPLPAQLGKVASFALLFAWLTSATLRAVHHLADVPWSLAWIESATAQTGLSVVWTVLGVSAWVAGSRRADRSVWLAGALLMGAVLLKLALVDRTHLGNLPGIVSFLAYGVLCTLVGYLAPAPPRAASQP